MITFLLIALAAAYLFWPSGNAATPAPAADDLMRWFPKALGDAPPPPPAPPATSASSAPAAREAIDSLLEVRDRLAATDSLDEDSAKAVDVLWLDLLHGSARK